MDNPGVPSTSLYWTLAYLDGITVLRSHSDPESEEPFLRWIGWSGGNLGWTKLGTGAYFLFLFLATTGITFLHLHLHNDRTLHVLLHNWCYCTLWGLQLGRYQAFVACSFQVCFSKFLLCYALVPNTNPIMLIILYVLYRLIHDNTSGNLLFHDFISTTSFLCSQQTSYNYTWL